MQLFVAGLSYREIARAVGLRSPQSVCNIVERGLADGGPRREPLADDALAMFIERSEAVLRAHWRRAMEGDVRATEAVRRIMDMQARVHGLYGGEARGGRGRSDEARTDPERDEDGMDSLERWRRDRAQTA